jgi:hypothetical protein
MAETIRKVDYFHVMLPDKPGEGLKVLSSLAGAGVNLLALTAFPSGGRAQLDLVPDDPAKLEQAAKKLALDLSPRKSVFLLQGADRVGALTDTLQKLASANISVTAANAVTTGDGRYGAIFWVAPESVSSAAKAIGAR